MAQLIDFVFIIKGFAKIWTKESILTNKTKIRLFMERLAQDENGNPKEPEELTEAWLEDFATLMKFQKKVGGVGKFREFMENVEGAGFLESLS